LDQGILIAFAETWTEESLATANAILEVEQWWTTLSVETDRSNG
jgi:hypothetical protein